MTNLTHNSFLCIYFNSLHVSSNLVFIIRRMNCINTTSGICHSVSVTVPCAGRNGLSDLHTKRSPTQSDIYQMMYWYNWFSWWWARGCSKHIENWNKYIEKNCASNWSFTKNHNKMHGQRDIKKLLHVSTPRRHRQGVITTKVCKPTCQHFAHSYDHNQNAWLFKYRRLLKYLKLIVTMIYDMLQ